VGIKINSPTPVDIFGYLWCEYLGLHSPLSHPGRVPEHPRLAPERIFQSPRLDDLGGLAPLCSHGHHSATDVSIEALQLQFMGVPLHVDRMLLLLSEVHCFPNHMLNYHTSLRLKMNFNPFMKIFRI
jgi:hypothetical protein